MRNVYILLLAIFFLQISAVDAFANGRRLLDCIKIASHLGAEVQVAYDVGRYGFDFEMVESVWNNREEFLGLARGQYNFSNTEVRNATRFDENYWVRLQNAHGERGAIIFLIERIRDCNKAFSIR